MMEIMVLSSTPKREDVVQAPREIVTGMSIDSLMQTQANPDIDGDDMQVLG